MIPKVIWQWWAGEKPPPLKLIQTWKDLNPSFEHHLVTRTTGWKNQTQFDKAASWHMKSDVVRYELLQEGGIWIDADAECILPLDERFLWPECWAGYEHEEIAPGLIASGMFGARAGSPFVRDMIEAIRKTDLSKPYWSVIGPDLFTRVAKQHPELVVFPSKTFYPTYFNGKPCPESKEPSFALHHWGGTKGLRRGTGKEEGVWLDHPPVDNPPLHKDNLPRPTVSVIIPCKGEAQVRYLHEAVESVQKQTFKDWEICVAVGGAHAEGVAEYWDSQPNIRVVRGITKGLADARNRAISVARGKYILPLDADDRLGPDMIERLLGVIGTEEFAIAACSAQEFGLKCGIWPRDPNGWTHILERNAIPLSSLYTRRIWEALGGGAGGGAGGGYDVAAVGYEDWAFWIACSELKPSVMILTEPLFHYRVHIDSMSHSEWADGAKTIWEALIHLRHPSLYKADRLTRDRVTLAGASEKMKMRVKARFDDFPGHHGLRTLSSMMQPSAAPALSGASGDGLPPGFIPPPSPVEVPRTRPISAIVPCGPGHAKFLAECVASIRAQTLQPLEIIIATSEPEALAVAAKLAEERGATVLTRPGGTAAQARNSAISATSGEWIWNLDADDTADPTFLQKASSYAWQYERPIISSDTQFFGAPHLASLNRAAIGRSSSGTCRYPPPSTVLTTCPIGSCVLFAKCLWEASGGFDERLTCGEDWEFWIRCIKKFGAQVTQLHEHLHRYRIHEDSVMESVHAEGREAQMIAEIQALHPDLYPPKAGSGSRA